MSSFSSEVSDDASEIDEETRPQEVPSTAPSTMHGTEEGLQVSECAHPEPRLSTASPYTRVSHPFFSLALP